MYRVIVAPIVSEKAARHEQEGIYTFLVERAATKHHVRQAIKELYGVAPIRISIQNTEGKRVRFGRGMGRRSDYKKAFVKIPKGSLITVHEGV
jgi:large subunit ribosomal protein L23